MCWWARTGGAQIEMHVGERGQVCGMLDSGVEGLAAKKIVYGIDEESMQQSQG
jgi:hypothetical protein